MSSPISELERMESEVLQWPPQRRAEFAERLLQSLADVEPATAELSSQQIDEIVRRQNRHRNAEGEVTEYRESLSRLDRALAEFRK